MPQNIPVRLVHSDGTITQIMATDVALDVEKKTGGIPLPFAGSKRAGFDFNLSNATIIINGIMSDSNIVSSASSAQGAFATIDFSTSVNFKKNFISQDWLPDNATADSLTLVGSTRITSANPELAKVKISLVAADGTPYVISMVSRDGAVANHSGITSGNYYIAIYRHTGGSEVKGTHAEIADNLVDLITNDSVLQTKFTAVLQTSTITDEANTQVRITQITTGKEGNTQSPLITGLARNQFSSLPLIKTFAGGKGNEGVRSAGDKVMDLFGIINNSDNATILSRIQAVGSAEKWQGKTNIGKNGNQFGDYITGIQIPFNSLYHAQPNEAYNVRNFWMPTGAKYMAWEKGSESAEAGNVEFDADERNAAGIKGTVQKATFTQLGGEPIWSFTIVFAPIDLIW